MIQVQLKGNGIFLGEVGDEERRGILAFKKILKTLSLKKKKKKAVVCKPPDTCEVLILEHRWDT